MLAAFTTLYSAAYQTMAPAQAQTRPQNRVNAGKNGNTCLRLSYLLRTFSLISASTSMVDRFARGTYSPPSPGSKPATQHAT